MDSDEDTVFINDNDSRSTITVNFDSDIFILQMIKENDSLAINFVARGGTAYIQNMTDDDWEELGRDISNNTHLETLKLHESALNDQNMSCLFRGLTRSSSLDKILLFSNQSISVAGVRSMVPFLQHSSKLTSLNLSGSNIQSEGFNLLLRSLCDSPIKELSCESCGIQSIEIDSEHIPKYLECMYIGKNSVDNDGCRELTKLLQGDYAGLTELHLMGKKIDDAGVAILVDALQHNTSLKRLPLFENDGISKQGRIMLLKLVNDISSIEATLESNHTLEIIRILDLICPIQARIDEATRINSSRCNTNTVEKAKVVKTQLHSARRAVLCRLQDVDQHSVFSEIDPLHLPEVLALIDSHNGKDELYLALSSSIMTLLSTVNVKKYIQQERAYHAATVEVLDAKLASMEEEEPPAAAAAAAATTERNECDNDNQCCSDRVESVKSRSNKRRRK